MSATISPDRAAVFAALGDTTRLQLLERLADGRSRSIQDLAVASPISRQALTKHLHVLERARLVRSSRFGREVRFRLEQAELDRAQAFLAHVSRQWAGAMQRLAAHVEDD
jgi:DNA-binding transcriptional ArsR family regulator